VRELVGERRLVVAGEEAPRVPGSVLATVMFTDIVDSTKRAVELGDRQWRALLDRHDETVRQQLTRFRGNEVKNLGDGFMATFDGPARAIRCALSITERAGARFGLEVRTGLHTGEIEQLDVALLATASTFSMRRLAASALSVKGRILDLKNFVSRMVIVPDCRSTSPRSRRAISLSRSPAQ